MDNLRAGGALALKAHLSSAPLPQVRTHGPGMAGSLFGAGWCFWLDAVLINGLNSHTVPFVEVRPVLQLCGFVRYQPLPNALAEQHA